MVTIIKVSQKNEGVIKVLKSTTRQLLMLLLVLTVIFTSVACSAGNKDPNMGSNGQTNETEEPAGEDTDPVVELKLSGAVDIDGSSTVFPITEAVAEEFNKVYPDVKVTVGVSGTGGGFKRFCAGETAITNASRPIKADKEVPLCQENKVDYIELPVAYDGLSVIVNPKNTWVDHLTVVELNAIFKPGSTVKTWKDVRAAWPDQEIKLYSPGADSGTFDYFTEAVNGESQLSRNDTQLTFSEDDNTLVAGIAGDQYALGYFGFAYFEANKDKLKLVPIDGGAGPISPSTETINDGTYAPLSRPLYIYVSKTEMERPEVAEFTSFYITNAAALSAEVGYVALPQAMYDEGLAKLE